MVRPSRAAISAVIDALCFGSISSTWCAIVVTLRLRPSSVEWVTGSVR